MAAVGQKLFKSRVGSSGNGEILRAPSGGFQLEHEGGASPLNDEPLYGRFFDLDGKRNVSIAVEDQLDASDPGRPVPEVVDLEPQLPLYVQRCASVTLSEGLIEDPRLRPRKMQSGEDSSQRGQSGNEGHQEAERGLAQLKVATEPLQRAAVPTGVGAGRERPFAGGAKSAVAGKLPTLMADRGCLRDRGAAALAL